MTESVSRGGGSGGVAMNADLLVDIGDVPFDGADAEDEFLGDLLIALANGDEA